MTIFSFLILMQIAPATLSDTTESLRIDSFRNPFRRHQAELEWIENQEKQAQATIQEATESATAEPGLQSQSGLLTGSQSERRLFPMQLQDLRGIAIVHGRNPWAMFGDRIVSVSDTIEGFTVLSISIESVTLSDSRGIVEVDLAKRQTTVRNDSSDTDIPSGKTEP